MPSSCPECGELHFVHDDVGSLVCTSCGTLADPSQAVLAEHDHFPTTVLCRPLRTSKGWHLAKTKQDRDRKNTIAMNTFINSVLSRLNNPGLSPRAEAIFTQAMARGHYRWGRKAKLVAGASIAIALREAHRSDSLRDIAFLLDDSTVSLARTFQSVVSLLDFSFASTDPAVHLPILHVFLQSNIHSETLSPPQSSQLPKHLLSTITPLSLQGAVRTATSLSQIISHHSPPLALATLPTPPTACALLILGLEAETRSPVPHLHELTRTLAARFALSPAVVSSRYRIIYNLVEEWIRHLPWLDQFVYKGKGHGAAARSNVSKRTIVARGTKDVIKFHEEIWLRRMQSQQRINLDLEHDPGSFANQEEETQEDNESVSTSAVASSSKSIEESIAVSPPNKQRRIEKQGKAMRVTDQIMLDPLSSTSLDPATSNGELSLLTHLLTCSPDELSRTRGAPLTRLQLLAASRGGSTEEYITDEELFANGELEGLFRSEQEREALQPLFQLNWGEELPMERAAVPHRKPVATKPKRGSKRINMGALARLLDEDEDGDTSNEEDEAGFPDSENAARLLDWHGYTHRSLMHQITTEGNELVNDWRPAASPDDDDSDKFGEFYDTADDRYEEGL